MIGVFDSGSGGLTVMRALEQALPTASFIYLGDHGNAPYGNRSPADIYALTLRGVERLFGLGCSLVIIACNTAAATGLRQLQQTWLPHAYPQHRVIGIIVPMIEAITGVPWETDTALAQAPAAAAEPAFSVAVFATRHTVDTGAYVTEIAKRAPAIRVSQQACPELAKLIDDGAGDQVIRPYVRAYVDALLTAQGEIPDVCILGCTHYPLIEHLFREALPQGVTLYAQGDVTAASLRRYLQRHPRFLACGAATTRYLTTGNPAHVSALAGRYYGRVVTFEGL